MSTVLRAEKDSEPGTPYKGRPNLFTASPYTLEMYHVKRKRPGDATVLDRLMLIDLYGAAHLCCGKPMERIPLEAAWHCVGCWQVLERAYVVKLRKMYEAGL